MRKILFFVFQHDAVTVEDILHIVIIRAAQRDSGIIVSEFIGCVFCAVLSALLLTLPPLCDIMPLEADEETRGVSDAGCGTALLLFGTWLPPSALSIPVDVNQSISFLLSGTMPLLTSPPLCDIILMGDTSPKRVAVCSFRLGLKRSITLFCRYLRTEAFFTPCAVCFRTDSH